MPIFITLNKIVQFNMQIGNIRCLIDVYELKSINKQHDTFMKNTFDIKFIHIMFSTQHSSVFTVLTFMSQHPIVDHRPHCLSSTSLIIHNLYYEWKSVYNPATTKIHLEM